MDVEKRFELIKRNTAEIISEEELRKLLKEKKKPVMYLGTAITGRPHIGYFVWVLKLADFLKAGFKVKLLLADIHGALDNTPWDVLEKRYDYYKAIIPLMFKSVGADIKNFEIVKGSDFQMKKEYIYDVLRLSTISTVHDANKAASDVVKLGDNPKLSGLLYPLMQTLDEVYLDADVQYGGTDQRKILVFAREHLPKMGYPARIEVMTPLIPGLVGKKMSASDPKSKIDLLDDEESVKQKINGAEITIGVIEDNGLLAFLKQVIMPLKSDKKQKFIVERPAKYGGNLEFKSYEAIEESYKEKKLHPLDLKNAVAREVNLLLKPMREERIRLEKLSKKAYE